ncbi:MAG: 50S ribosomal protein L22 [Parcubacteria group bacterium]|jgi:large subunit ribosomal protein L22
MQVSAKLNNYRKSPRKVRLVADMLKGLDVKKAEDQLKYLIKGSASSFEKLLKSAVANAENNFGLNKDNLYVKEVIVNEGARLKRWLPRAYGRASLLLKRTSRVEMILAERVEGKDRKQVKKQEIKEIKAEDKVKIESTKKESEKEAAKEERKPARIATRSVAGGEIVKEREEKEFLDEKKKAGEQKGFLKKVFRRKSM